MIHALLLALVLFPEMSLGSSCGDAVLPPVENPKDGACGDMDIRNSVKNFRKLENCTVIEGFLHISLIDYVPQEEYDKYSFPLLKEITGHLMMYRVFGLRTLRNLFPNLSVIRGQIKFFKDYALVAYEMRDLEELGLISLTVLGGSVRLTKNHKLCHISSIDWGKLTNGVDPSKHVFVDNREKQLCPDFCSESCPSTTYQEVTRRRCWTSQPDACQKNLECSCNDAPCTANGTCCNKQCIGGCVGPRSSDCYVCSKVIYNNTCLTECPPNTFMLSNRRCLTAIECLRLRSRTVHNNKTDRGDPLPKLLRGDGNIPSQCVFKCPLGYIINDAGNPLVPECIRCQESCPKVCNTTKVSSIQDSVKLMGCSKIDGSLEIQIMAGENIAVELTKNLGDIREVTDYIKIWKSHALLTLHFFKNLEIIGGERLVHKWYSFFVADNTNLQEIFPEQQMKKMIIRKGNITFHRNRKLCLNKITSFVEQLNITSQLSPKRVDISNSSNGNIPCRNATLKVKLTYLMQTLLVTWSPYDSSDLRQIINYIVQYKEVSEPVEDIFKGRDACSNSEWNTLEVKPSTSQKFIHGLKPFTKYALYVQAVTLPTAPVSAMSTIHYFQTSPSYPTEPTDLEVEALNPHELHVKWNKPKNPNGNITHYKIYYQMQLPNTKDFEQRDFCKDAPVSTKDVQIEKEKAKYFEEKKRKEMEHHKGPCCECPTSLEEMLKEQRIQELDIAFEDNLQGSAFTKKWGRSCQSDMLPNILQAELPQILPDLFSRGTDVDFNSSDGLDFYNPINFPLMPEFGLLPMFADNSTKQLNITEPTNPGQEVIVFETEATLPNLEHFHLYNIEVVACHETDALSGIKLCSNTAIITGQTLANPTADNLNISLIVVEPIVNKSGEVLLRWEPPPQPNGVILKYYIKYRRVDLDRSSIPVTVCVSTKQFQNNSNRYMLHGLAPGNYYLQIRAHSLSDNGSYTPEIFFAVPHPPGEKKDANHSLITGISVGVAIGIILSGVIIFWCIRQRHIKHQNVVVSENPHYIPTNQLYTPGKWEVPRDTIRLIKELGQGSFGTVFEGLMEDPETKISKPVAIKTVNDKAGFYERQRILVEATTMMEFECHHVIHLLGVVSKGQPALVVMELMALGDLRNHLRKCRVDEDNYPDFHPPTTNQIRQMAGEIADGMAYLSDKKIVHRDLAARNCLVSENGTVKIADFGMARDVYMTEYYRKDQKALLPVRWMAPESLKDGIFTTMSDIWSYGIVLWEMVTLAEQPYRGLANDEVLHLVVEGRVMNPPLGCPLDLCNMMQQCWSYNPKHRPTFRSVIHLLAPHLNDQFREVSYYYREIVPRDETEDMENEREYWQAIEIENEEKFEDAIAEVDPNFDGASSIIVREIKTPSHNSDGGDEEREDTGDGSLFPAHVLSSPSNFSHQGNSYNKGEQSPLILHQCSVQEPLLYPASTSCSAATVQSDDDDDEGINSEDDFLMNNGRKYTDTYKDAKSSSERLKLLSDPPNSAQSKLGTPPVKLPPSSLKIGGGGTGRTDEYTLMTPPASSSTKLNDGKSQFPSSPPLSSYSITSPMAASNPYHIPHTHLPSSAPASFPVLHVDMEGIGNSRSIIQKQSPTPVVAGHVDDSNKINLLLQGNNQLRKCGMANNNRKNQSDSSSNSTSNSHSGSEGSKESTTSSGSHHSFSSGTVNGHGPFIHQQAALC